MNADYQGHLVLNRPKAISLIHISLHYYIPSAAKRVDLPTQEVKRNINSLACLFQDNFVKFYI